MKGINKILKPCSQRIVLSMMSLILIFGNGTKLSAQESCLKDYLQNLREENIDCGNLVAGTAILTLLSVALPPAAFLPAMTGVLCVNAKKKAKDLRQVKRIIQGSYEFLKMKPPFVYAHSSSSKSAAEKKKAHNKQLVELHKSILPETEMNIKSLAQIIVQADKGLKFYNKTDLMNLEEVKMAIISGEFQRLLGIRLTPLQNEKYGAIYNPLHNRN